MEYNNKIGIEFVQKEGYTLIVSQGTRSNFSESLQTAEIIVQKMKGISDQKLLLDYREAKYDIPDTDAFNLIKVFELKLKAFKTFSMAVVINEETKSFGEYWAEVGRKRGMNFNIFFEIQEAENWIKDQ